MEIELEKIPNKRYFSTSEVSKIVGVKAHTLRYWEKEFENLFKVKKTANKRIFLKKDIINFCLLYTSPSPRDGQISRMPSSA